MESGINGRNAVDQIVARRTDFLSGVSNLNTSIHPGDGMLGNDEVGLQYYFQCGRSALDLIDRSLLCADRPRHRIRNVLDFACGFGRVTRWLVAAFPHAEDVGCDVDARSVQAVRDNLGVTAHVIKPDWSRSV
jgi:SAM-dependent methyltransferase